MPTISVIIPAYNAEKTILETISSVEAQTFSDFELIVINDGSTDRTLDLLNTVKDSRLKIFNYPNGGLAVARNRGLHHATGDFIAFIDADDLWTPEKLELQLAALQQHPEAGVSYSWAYYMDEKGEYIHADAPIFWAGNVYAQLLVRDFIVSGSNCLIRRQAVESVGEFDTSVSGSDDWDYWIRVAQNWHFAVVPELQIFYRQCLGSISSKVEVMEKNNLRVIEKAFQAAPPEMQSLKNQSLGNTYRFSAHLYLTRIATAEAAKQAERKLWTAFRLYPPILKDSWTRNLLIKVLLLRFVPHQISSSLIQFISKVRTNRNQRWEQSQI